MRSLLSLTLCFFCVPHVLAAQKPAAAKLPSRAATRSVDPRSSILNPQSVTVYPSELKLTSRRTYRQFVVTGMFNGEARDLTNTATYHSSNARVVKVMGGRAAATGDGTAVITVSCGGKSARVPVAVVNFAKPDPVSFRFETLALLTKQGCATGSCHGSPHGRGGFSLSLFGYDPRIDRVSLTRDGYSRRLNIIEPIESLMLKKPLLEVSHGGGKRLRKGETAYRTLHDWIYEGANTELSNVECERIDVFPGPSRLLRLRAARTEPSLPAPLPMGEGSTKSYLPSPLGSLGRGAGGEGLQQLSVLAHYTDGTARDVTAIATYDSSHAAIAGVEANGLVTGLTRGQAAISVRYLDKLESVHFTVIADVPGFVWRQPAENNLVDKLVHAKLKQLQYVPSETCSDEVFIRRVYLDLTGLLPPAERVREFLAPSPPSPLPLAKRLLLSNVWRAGEGGRGDVASKRAKLIDELLATEDFARFWALKKADLMRVSPKKLKDGRADLFAEWIVSAVRTNMRYDQFAREILTSAGDTKQVAAANYFLAIPTMEERTEMTTQIFMGSRLECAKCHNHPFENWTMRDYYSIAAVFARTRAMGEKEIRVVDAGEALLPTTKEPMTPWGATVGNAPARRIAFGEWLTKPGNPYFARVEVNRMWADLLGRGIVEPVDDFRSSNPPSNVPLLDSLAQEFARSGYDRKHVIRLICNSRAYQRSTATSKFNETDERLFSHARPRLLTAEQLKDAIAVAARQSKNRGEYATQRPYAEPSTFMTAFGQPKRETACTCERQSSPTLLQALELLNGSIAYQSAQAGAARYALFKDDQLIDELYLSAYSRFPTAQERATAKAYIAKAAKRDDGVMDLVWTVINTQEFLFQH